LVSIKEERWENNLIRFSALLFSFFGGPKEFPHKAAYHCQEEKAARRTSSPIVSSLHQKCPTEYEGN